MADFYELTEKEFLAFDPALKTLYTEEMLQSICLGLHSMCKGAEAKYFCGHTNHLSCLSREEFIKCKAVMEAENVYSLADTMALVQRLGEYDFDASITDEDAFAQRYLHQNLPPEFDAAVLGGAELFDLGTALLHRKHGSLTSYGVISHDEPLYAVIESPTEQAEYLDNGMGDLSL